MLTTGREGGGISLASSFLDCNGLVGGGIGEGRAAVSKEFVSEDSSAAVGWFAGEVSTSFLVGSCSSVGTLGSVVVVSPLTMLLPAILPLENENCEKMVKKKRKGELEMHTKITMTTKIGRITMATKTKQAYGMDNRP